MEPCWFGSDENNKANGCVFLPGDEEGCTAESECNHNNPQASEEDCLEDKLNNGGYFCGECWGGGFCHERSELPECRLNSPWSDRPNSWTEDKCTNISGTVFGAEDTWNPWNKRCVLADLDTSDKCFGSCYGDDGPDPGREMGCVNKEFNDNECWDYTNEWGWHVAFVNWFWNPTGHVKVCQIWTDQEGCSEFEGFSWDNIVEETKWSRAQRCQRNYCYNKAVDRNQCYDYSHYNEIYDKHFNWEHNLNNGTGACVTWIDEYNKDWASIEAECEAIGEGWSYYTGRWFQEGMVHNQELCEIGVCNHNPWLNEEECAEDEFCTFGCLGCTRGYNSEYERLCFHKNQTSCDGDWNTEHDMCIIDASDITDCNSKCDNCTYAECKNYDDDTCSEGPYQDILQCQFQWKNCETKEDCTKQGECSDWNLQNFNSFNNFYDPSAKKDESAGVCVFPKIVNEWGWTECNTHGGNGGDRGGDDKYGSGSGSEFDGSHNGGEFDGSHNGGEFDGSRTGGEFDGSHDGERPECFCKEEDRQKCIDEFGDECPAMCDESQEFQCAVQNLESSEANRPNNLRWVENGCASDDISNKTNCESLGGEWMKRASNRTQCEAARGCLEPGRGRHDLTSKSPEECTQCGGRMVPYFTWHGGNWIKGAVTPLEWKKREKAAVNTWGPAVEEDLVRQYIDKAIGSKIADAFRAELSCRYNPVRSLLKTIACQCGVNTGDECSNSALDDAELADSTMVCGQSETIATGGFEVTFGNSSILDCEAETDVSLSQKFAVRKGTDESDDTILNGGGNRRRLRRLLGETDNVPCYATVYNAASTLIVGQTRGDCLVFTSSSAIQDVELCMSTKSSIPHDAATYPNAAVALSSTDSQGETVLNVQDIDVFESGEQYCITVSESGTYCPVSVIDNHDTAVSHDAGSCTASTELTQVFQTQAALLSTATTLSFVTEPADGSSTKKAGDIWADSFQVALVDSDGNTVTDAQASITLNIKSGSGTSGATLDGTARVAATNGIATFDSVSIDLAGSDYVLTASASTLIPGECAAFVVAAGDPTAVKFVKQPAGAVVSSVFLQQPTVAITDSAGSKVTTAVDSVTIEVSSGDGSLTGTTTVSAVAGLATFSGLALDTLGEDYQLKAYVADSEYTNATSTAFDVVDASGYPVKLAFEAVLDDALAGSVFTTQPSVVIQDSLGATVETASHDITVAIKEGSGASSGSLVGTVTISAVNGVASFSGLGIDLAGSDYILEASADSLASASSNTFTVNGVKALVFSSTLQDVSQNAAFSVAPVVQIVDLNDQVMTTRTDYITITIKSGSGTPGAGVYGVIRRKAASGVATFTGLVIDEAGTNYRLSASTDAGITGTSNTFDVTSSSSGDDDDDDDDDDDSPAANVAAGVWSIVLPILTIAFMATGLIM